MEKEQLIHLTNKKNGLKQSKNENSSIILVIIIIIIIILGV